MAIAVVGVAILCTSSLIIIFLTMLVLRKCCRSGVPKSLEAPTKPVNVADDSSTTNKMGTSLSCPSVGKPLLHIIPLLHIGKEVKVGIDKEVKVEIDKEVKEELNVAFCVYE